MILSELIQDYINGIEVKRLKSLHGISKAKIYKLLKKENILRNRNDTKEKRKQIKINSQIK